MRIEAEEGFVELDIELCHVAVDDAVGVDGTEQVISLFGLDFQPY